MNHYTINAQVYLQQDLNLYEFLQKGEHQICMKSYDQFIRKATKAIAWQLGGIGQ